MSEFGRDGDLQFELEYPILDPDSNLLIGGFVNYNIEPLELDGIDDGPLTFLETSFSTVEPGDQIATAGSERIISFPSNMDVRLNDIFVFTSTEAGAANPVVIKAQVIELNVSPSNSDSNIFTYHRVRCIFVSENLEDILPRFWTVKLEAADPLFETKFGRFGYRYKYEDGECSAFSPWSELAFLPGEFSYTARDGFNLGVQNNVRRLTVRGFIPDDSIRPSDVRTVDILWKTTDDANVYVVKSITRELDNEWEDFVNTDLEGTGSLTITSEMINRVLESNQLLRAWDNVPRVALAQEITAGRLVYGNYLQGYDINTVVGLKQTLISEPVDFPVPKRSVKTMRSYKWGMVFGDKYGRETPVLANGFRTDLGETITGDTTVPKSLCGLSNSFELEQNWNQQPLEWMDYVKYYVKETSSEYYNLVLDRWYESGDGGVWLAFPSSDRNKVDLETYLLLKNEHGTQEPVSEKARYKILAIENEAPDFIKRKESVFDRVSINRENIYGPYDGDTSISNVTDAVPTQLIDTTKLKTNSISFPPLDTGTFSMQDFKGDAEVRIVGTYTTQGSGLPLEVFSEYRKLNFIQTAGINTTFSIGEQFSSEDVNMYQKILNLMESLGEDATNDPVQANVDDDGGGIAEENNVSYIRYFLEFRDVEVKNEPEFDGRFFVKINRDATLDQRVFGLSSSTNYSIDAEFKVGYIASIANNPATVGAFANDSTAFTPDFVPGFTNANIEQTIDQDSTFGVFPSNNFCDVAEFSFFTGSNGASGNSGAGFNNNYEVAPTPPALSGAGNVPVFGPGVYQPTRAFWTYWAENKDTPIFIDQATAAYGYNHWARGVDNLLNGSDYGYSGSDNFNGRVLAGFVDTPLPINYLIPSSSEAFGANLGENNDPNDNIINSGSVILGSNAYLNYAHNSWGTGMFRTENFAPTGLSAGNMTNGDLGQICFSVAGVKGSGRDQFSTDPDAIQFKAAMQNVGTLFRFKEDVNNVVYVVTSNEQQIQIYNVEVSPIAVGTISAGGGQTINVSNIDAATEGSSYTFDGEITMGTDDKPIGNYIESNVPNQNFVDSDEPGAYRSSIIIRFARANAINEPIVDQGLDPEQFDPRGTVQHNGLGFFTIEILSPSVEDGSLSSQEIETTGACFETEPKESVDIDIYYEASQAIPIRLNSDNIQSFVGSDENPNFASKFYVKNRIGGNNLDIQQPFPQIAADAYVQNFVANDGVIIRHNVSISENGNVESDFLTPSGNFPSVTNHVNIGDIVCFRRPDGFETKSKVLDHYRLIQLNGKDSVGLSNRFTITIPASGILPNLDNGLTVLFVQTTSEGGSATDENGNNVFVLGQEFLGNASSVTNIGTVVSGMNVTSLNDDENVLANTVNVTGSQQTNFIGDTQFTFILLPVVIDPTLPSIQNNGLTLRFVEQTGIFKLDSEVWRYPSKLSWFNCYSFGNGVESDRIRDDFNAPQIDNGCRVSSTFLDYGEERITSGLIHSGLYNSVSSVNNLNEFNMAEKITKNLNPAYGSIQALKTRQNNIAVFTQDKVLKVLANKDAVFNADGNPQLIATNRVLGDATPYAGDYGISNNPESLAGDQYRLYFTDQQRGAVLRLSRDGITPISNVGMRTWFRDNLKNKNNLIGSFDTVSGEYNLHLSHAPNDENFIDDNYTLSFNEGSKGWVSFKSFLFSTGVSVSGNYYTTSIDNTDVIDEDTGTIEDARSVAKSAYVWQHHTTRAPIQVDVGGVTQAVGQLVARNTFYAGGSFISTIKNCSIKIIFNDLPGLIKSFTTLYYSGSVARSIEVAGDGEFESLQDGNARNGWQCTDFTTDQQTGRVYHFDEKEWKWFGMLRGEQNNDATIISSTLNNVGEDEANTMPSITPIHWNLSSQGLGFPLQNATNVDNVPFDPNVTVIIDLEDED
jgi:hypothetical protein